MESECKDWNEKKIKKLTTQRIDNDNKSDPTNSNKQTNETQLTKMNIANVELSLIIEYGIYEFVAYSDQ